MNRRPLRVVEIILLTVLAIAVAVGLGALAVWMNNEAARIDAGVREVSDHSDPDRALLDSYDWDALQLEYEIALDLIEPVYRGEPMLCEEYWSNPWQHVNAFIDGFIATAPDEIAYLVTRTEMIRDVETRIVRACPGA